MIPGDVVILFDKKNEQPLQPARILAMLGSTVTRIRLDEKSAKHRREVTEDLSRYLYIIPSVVKEVLKNC